MDETTAAAQQDAMRPFRAFVSALDRSFYADQSFAGSDANIWNAPGQFSTVGPYSTAVEGQPITLTRNGGVAISPAVVLLALGALAMWALR